MADARTSSDAFVEGVKAVLRDLVGIRSPSRSFVDAWASAYDRTALGALKRRIADSASAFVDFMIDATPGGREETDRETRRIVAKAEAEGAALIGALPCPADHEPEGLSGFLVRIGAVACPVCGAQV